MTFEELERELPNGFHDAHLLSLSVDYVSGTAELRMDLLFGTPESADPEEYRAAVLRITGIHFFSIGPPDSTYSFVPDGRPLWLLGGEAKSDPLPGFDKLMAKLPKEVSCFRFFVDQWNSFIHIAARDVQFSWLNVDGPGEV